MLRFSVQLRTDLEMRLTFESSEFEKAFDAAVAECDVLSREEAEHFVANGFVVIKDALTQGHVHDVCENAWRELESEHGVSRKDPLTWAKKRRGRGPAGYARLNGSRTKYDVKSTAPRAFYAQTDLIGGSHRLLSNGDLLTWSDGVVSNLGVEDDPPWQPPSPRQPGWHKDGWHFRHFLNSPEQGLVTVPLYSDIQPRSGGTFLAIDSIAPVGGLLCSAPEGLHPDSVQGGGYLIPGLIEQCSQFAELTGNAGDLALLHPYMLHRVSINPSARPRFIANMALVLAEPMCFNRAVNDSFSLVELTVLHALGQSCCEFDQQRPMQGFKPFPFRHASERQAAHELLQAEMRTFAERGIVSPTWSQDLGYMSNRQFVES